MDSPSQSMPVNIDLLREILPTLITEWEMLQVITAALLSTIFAIFQFSGASIEPVMRTAGFMSFVCAFAGFVYAWLFIIHFRASGATSGGGTDETIGMNELEAATNTSHQRTEMLYSTEDNRPGFWNIPIILALPAIWAAWSIITFTIFVLLFLWSTNPSTGSFMPGALSHKSQVQVIAAPIADLIPRVTATVVLLVEVVYLVLAIHALRSWRELA